MKVKISISIEQKTLKNVEKTIKNNIFRNKSHFIELATQKMLEEVEDDS